MFLYSKAFIIIEIFAKYAAATVTMAVATGDIVAIVNFVAFKVSNSSISLPSHVTPIYHSIYWHYQTPMTLSAYLGDYYFDDSFAQCCCTATITDNLLVVAFTISYN